MGSTSILGATVTQSDIHHRVGIIVGACLGTAGGVLLLGLVLFWIFLRHRHHTATAQLEDAAPCSWLPSASGNMAIVANDPSMNVDLTGADIENGSVVLPSVQAAETKEWDESADVLDISMHNAHPSPFPPPPSPPSTQLLPDPIEPYVPTPLSQRTPTLRIHTDVPAEPLSRALHVNTPDGPSRSPIRPLPTLPTRPSMRWPRSAKTEEAQRESPRSRMPRPVVSADDLRVYRRDTRRSRAHCIGSLSGEVDECEIVQHHDGGVDARIDLPPPYYECLQVQAATSVVHSASQALAWP